MFRKSLSTAAALAAVIGITTVAAAQAPGASSTHVRGALDAYAGGADYAVIDSGSTAPDVSFEYASGWMRLKDFRQMGHVLLVISPSKEQLVAIEHERNTLVDMGVVPVAVLDERPGTCRELQHSLQLGYTLASDTRRVIGAQFNALEPSSRADAPAWFVIDHKGRVRELGHGSWPEGTWTTTCANALGLPAPDAPRPASYRH